MGSPAGEPHTVRLLFQRENRQPYYRQRYEILWTEVRAAAGAPATSVNGFHVLRRTFASACLASGVDIRTLAEWLGHDDPGFTLKVYGHLMPSAAARGRQAIDKFLRDES
ncbi:tyrosine-type recombinase/integrase [Spirillospora sp. NBC_01491]|uniref:tyrosine-type recombinase/integrase n=1 Tax=Spirillospora sp. NBC_01491 TaxID=2976007 RepID=UPI002E34DDA2|nr:tyrosine-type recombinase/integrase [Spirillospora sp. NBC_01491]